jgi:phage baseplate assembly protein V
MPQKVDPPLSSPSSQQMAGVHIGKVVSNVDPKKSGCVQVQVAGSTGWAPVATPAAGGGWGLHFVPDVGSEVLVAFVEGDIRKPYVVGCLWSGGNAPGSSMTSVIRSRQGHEIVLDDTPGVGSLTLKDGNGLCSIQLDATNGTVTIKATGGLKLECDTQVEVNGALIKLNNDALQVI